MCIPFLFRSRPSPIGNVPVEAKSSQEANEAQETTAAPIAASFAQHHALLPKDDKRFSYPRVSHCKTCACQGPQIPKIQLWPQHLQNQPPRQFQDSTTEDTEFEKSEEYNIASPAFQLASADKANGTLSKLCEIAGSKNSQNNEENGDRSHPVLLNFKSKEETEGSSSANF